MLLLFNSRMPLTVRCSSIWTTTIVLFINLLWFATGSELSFTRGVCKPSESPQLPKRLFPLSELHNAFERIANATQIINDRRAQLAASQPRGTNYAYVQHIFMGVQLDALGPENLAQVLPAIDLALDSIQNTTAYNGVTFTTVPILHLTSIACDSLALLAKLDNREINVLFGPLNDFSIANAARFTSSMYNVPIVTPGGFAHQLGDKIEYSSLTRVFFTYSDLPWLINTTLRQYGWTADKLTPIGLYAARNQRQRGGGIGHTSLVGVFQQQSINNFLMKAGFKVFQITTDEYSGVVEQFLNRLPENSRVAILCADPSSVRYIMLKAHELGLTGGDYVFISIDLFSNAERLERPWYQTDSTDAENVLAREAYRALMTISLRRPNSEAYNRFSKEVRSRALRDYGTHFYDSEVRTFVGLFHDAVKLYFHALDDAREQGIPITEGKTITHLMWNRTFEGVTGTVRIDSNGDRNADYSLLDLDLEQKKFRVVANYFGNDHSMHPLPDRSIDWINEDNAPPPGIPRCGFDGSGCQNSYILIVGGVGAGLFGLLTILAIILGVYFYRRAELQAISWIIDWPDLEFSEKPTDDRSPLLGDQNPSPTPNHTDDPNGSLLVKGGNAIQLDPRCSIDQPDVSFTNVQAPPTRRRRKSFLGSKRNSNGQYLGTSPTVPNNTSNTGHGTSYTSSNQPDRRRGTSRTVSTDPPTEDTAVTPTSHMEDVVYSATAIKRFQSRWHRRSRANDDPSGFSNFTFPSLAPAPMTGHQRVSVQRGDAPYPPYIKNPSFDYTSVISKQRQLHGRGRCETIECDTNIWSDHSTGRRKKDSQASRYSTEANAYASHLQSSMQGTIAMYKGSKVYLRPVRRQNRIESNKETAVEVNKVKDMNNDHICRLIGVCLEPTRQCFVMEYCPKKSLYEFLRKEQFTMDWLFKLSLIQDICRGMTYLHQILVVHGNLKSCNCLLDSRFSVKLTDFGLPRLRVPNPQKYDYGTHAYYHNLLWTAPELLPIKDTCPSPTYKGDVYGFSIICQELIYRKGPFFIDEANQTEPSDIIAAVQALQIPSYRPTLHVIDEGSDEVIKMIRTAWDDDPVKRPDFRAIGKQIGTDTTENLIDNLLDRMQGITTNLEVMVEKRTSQYMDEKKRAEDLLYSMLPRTVASQLINKKHVDAESFDRVSIYFSDIVGFTAISADSKPIEVVNLLNALYTLFDDISGNFRVYKVETIGDAYMVASGLPRSIGDDHAREIARMSIAFLKSIFEFKIPHKPEQQLKLRIGVHSGPVCAGVVGQRMPRYCLFGDTVNTASRMESNGSPLRIHISEQTVDVLRTFGTFIMTKRGAIEMKGKGEQTTYWLHGEGSFLVDPVPDGEPLVGGPYEGLVLPIGPRASASSNSSLHQQSYSTTPNAFSSTPLSAESGIGSFGEQTTPSLSPSMTRNMSTALRTIPEGFSTNPPNTMDGSSSSPYSSPDGPLGEPRLSRSDVEHLPSSRRRIGVYSIPPTGNGSPTKPER